MRNPHSVDLLLVDLREFNELVWRELSADTPRRRRARRLAGVGIVSIGMAVTSLVLYVIYRGIGATLVGVPGPIPGSVWIAATVAIGVGLTLVGIAAAMTGLFRFRARGVSAIDEMSTADRRSHSIGRPTTFS